MKFWRENRVLRFGSRHFIIQHTQKPPGANLYASIRKCTPISHTRPTIIIIILFHWKHYDEGMGMKIDLNALKYNLLQLGQFKRITFDISSITVKHFLARVCLHVSKQALVSTQYSKQSLRFYNTKMCVIIRVKGVSSCKRFRCVCLAIRSTDE